MAILKPVFHLSVGLVFLSFLGGVGCTTKAEQASSSKEQEIRGESDRFFQKMEQEEKTRGSSNKE